MTQVSTTQAAQSIPKNGPSAQKSSEPTPQQVAKDIFESGENRWGVDAQKFVALVTGCQGKRFDEVNGEYIKLTDHGLDKAATEELSGEDLETVEKWLGNREIGLGAHKTKSGVTVSYSSNNVMVTGTGGNDYVALSKNSKTGETTITTDHIKGYVQKDGRDDPHQPILSGGETRETLVIPAEDGRGLNIILSPVHDLNGEVRNRYSIPPSGLVAPSILEISEDTDPHTLPAVSVMCGEALDYILVPGLKAGEDYPDNFKIRANNVDWFSPPAR